MQCHGKGSHGLNVYDVVRDRIFDMTADVVTKAFIADGLSTIKEKDFKQAIQSGSSRLY